MSLTTQTTTLDALRYLAHRCDGAHAVDGAGFNKFDADFGRSLAERDRLTERQEFAALKMMRKYRAQLERGGFHLEDLYTAFAQREHSTPQAAPASRTIDVEGDAFVIHAPYDRALVEAMRRVPDRHWDPVRKVNTVPVDRCLEVETFAQAHGFTIAPAARRVIDEQRDVAQAERRRVEGVIAASTATDSDVEVCVEGLRPFQRAGVSYLLDRRRSFLADEMGLGKSVEALATLETDGLSYPALIICPKSVVPSWRREVKQWLPERSVQVVDTTCRAGQADITIIHYDALARRIDILNRGFHALIADESHFLKNHKAKRTKIVQFIADKLEGEDPIILCLSGTPLVNRPGELIAQLRIMRRLEDLGGFTYYRRHFCADGERGSQNLNELNVELRGACMIRRLKADVLTELPPRTFTDVETTLDNEDEYRFAEAQFLAWVRQTGGDALAAARAETLTRLNALRQLTAKGKTATALEWIRDFLDTDGKLIVFAHHRQPLDAILEGVQNYNPRTLRAEDSVEQRAANIDAFQNDPSVRVIVCSLKAAGIGVTLTAASNVCFLELGWTPADMLQAVDRAHRIGQHDAVTGWQLVAPDTIDDFMSELLAEKREIIDAVLDGTASADQDQSIVSELVDRMVSRAR